MRRVLTFLAIMAFATTLHAQSPVFRPLHVSAAGTVADDLGHPVLLRGLNRSATGYGNADANATDQDYQQQNQLLSMNVVRIFVNSAWWMSNVPVPIAGTTYQSYIDQLIQRAKKYGNYVLILKAGQFPDAPCGANGVNCPASNQGDLNCLANPALCTHQDTTGTYIFDALQFWDQFVQRYASDPAILYDTWENMRGLDPDTWSNNENELIATIRVYSPGSLIFVGDTGSAFEAIVAGTELDLAWSNIVWNFHIYNGAAGACSDPVSSRYANWSQNFDPLVNYAQQNGHAAVISEWGGCNDSEPYHTNITSYARTHSVGLIYFDSSNLITVAGGTSQLTAVGVRVAAVYAGLSGCNYTLSAGGQSFPAAGGTGTIGITTSPGCAWSGSGLPSWVIGATSGTGSDIFSYQVTVNSGPDRSATITVAGISFTIEQEATSIPGLVSIGSMAHIAAEGGWTTAFTLVNKGASGLARLSVFGDPSDATGNGPLAVPLAFPQQPAAPSPLVAATLDRTISTNASLVINTAGPQTGPVLVGSAQLAATGFVDGFAIFRQLSTAQEAAVPMETRNASSYLLAFDNTNGVTTSVAVANVSPQFANIGVVIRDETGVQIPTSVTVITLAGGGHKSFVLPDPATGFPVTANRRGTIEFDAPLGVQISVLGIRSTPPNHALTTVPALANVGTGGGSIAHIASGNGWQTTFVLVNTGTGAAQIHLKFFADVTGAPLSLPLSFPQPNGGADTVASSVDQTLAAGATLLVLSAAPLSNPLPTTGSAQLTTNGNVGGFVIFRFNPSGQEAVVPLETRNANAYILAFDNTPGKATGIAINAVSSAQVNVPVVIRDENGTQIGPPGVVIVLAGNAHKSFVLSDPATGGFLVTAGIRGTIEFDAPLSGQIGAIGIRNTGQAFTTLPALVK